MCQDTFGLTSINYDLTQCISAPFSYDLMESSFNKAMDNQFLMCKGQLEKT